MGTVKLSQSEKAGAKVREIFDIAKYFPYFFRQARVFILP